MFLFFGDNLCRTRNDSFPDVRLFHRCGLTLGLSPCVFQMPFDGLPSEKRDEKPRNPARERVVSEEFPHGIHFSTCVAFFIPSVMIFVPRLRVSQPMTTATPVAIKAMTTGSLLKSKAIAPTAVPTPRRMVTI